MTILTSRPAINPVHRQQCLEQAARCRRLAFATSDRQAADVLLAMAIDYERNAWANGATSAAV